MTDTPGLPHDLRHGNQVRLSLRKVTEWEARRNALAFIDERFVDPPPGLDLSSDSG